MDKDIELFEDKKVAELIESVDTMLEGMTSEERLLWFKETQYPYPLCFETEIDGTVYTVEALFSDGANESIAEKTERLLLRQCTD